MIPSWNALLQHQQRATYVLRLVYSSPRLQCADLDNFTAYGWQLVGSSVEIVWDSPLSEQSPETVIDSVDTDSSSDESDEDVNETCESRPDINEYGSDSDYEL